MQKILVLDDNPDILEAVAAVLTRHRMDVITLDEPAQLESYIAAYSPDILLMDIAMGNYDGRVLCREIKRSLLDSHIPVILFSAMNYSVDSITHSLADGMICKPLGIDELLYAIQRLLPAASVGSA